MSPISGVYRPRASIVLMTTLARWARSISEDDSSDSIEVMRKPGDTKTMTRWPGNARQTFQNLFDVPVDIVRLGVAAGQRSLAGRFGQVLRLARSWSDRPEGALERVLPVATANACVSCLFWIRSAW